VSDESKAALTDAQPTWEPDPKEILPGGMSRAAFLRLHEENPVAAARYATAHGVYASDPTRADPHGLRAQIVASRAPVTHEEQHRRAYDALAWARGESK
jgi:hypothetical protein